MNLIAFSVFRIIQSVLRNLKNVITHLKKSRLTRTELRNVGYWSGRKMSAIKYSLSFVFSAPFYPLLLFLHPFISGCTRTGSLLVYMYFFSFFYIHPVFLSDLCIFAFLESVFCMTIGYKVHRSFLMLLTNSLEDYLIIN